MEIASLPNPAELLELRSTRTALVELCLLARRRRAARARSSCCGGSRSSPTRWAPPPSPARCWHRRRRFSPRMAALGVALGYAGGVERAGRARARPRRRRHRPAAGRRPGRRRDPGQRRVRVERVGRPAAVRHRDRARRAPTSRSPPSPPRWPRWASRCSAAPGPRSPSTPTGAPALGLPAARADLALLALVAFAAVAALPAVGALLVTSLFVVPAAIARLLRRQRAGARRRSRSAWRRSRARSGCTCSLWLDVPPGPAVAVAGRRPPTRVAAAGWRRAAMSAVAARGAGRRATARGPVLTRRRVRGRARHRRVRARAQRRRQDHPVPRAHRRARAARGLDRGGGPPRATWPRPSAPGSTSR